MTGLQLTSIVSVLDAHHVVNDAVLRRYLRWESKTRTDDAERELRRRGWSDDHGLWCPEGETGVWTLGEACEQALEESL